MEEWLKSRIVEMEHNIAMYNKAHDENKGTDAQKLHYFYHRIRQEGAKSFAEKVLHKLKETE